MHPNKLINNHMRVNNEKRSDKAINIYWIIGGFIASPFNPRLQVAALGVGTAQGALDKAVAHVRQRRQFGAPLASLQLVQGKIAEMATKTEAARSICYRAASKLDMNQADPALSSMAKWYCAEVADQVADEAIQLHAGNGILKEYNLAHYRRNAKVLEIFKESREVEKVIVAKKIPGNC